MDSMTNENGCRGNLTLFLLALAVLARLQPGLAQTPNWTEVPITQLREAAEQANPEAQLVLGNAYRWGWQGAPKDHHEALKWYRRAGYQGNPEAQFSAGRAYALGEGTTRDYRQAAKWYRLAAEQGYVNAQVALAHKYQEGLGVAQDAKEAEFWYHRAAVAGDTEAQFRLGVILTSGKATGIARIAEPMNYQAGRPRLPSDTEVAAIWFRRAAEQGMAEAQSMLATMHLEGVGVPEDWAAAYAWLSLAAAQGTQTAAKLKDTLRDMMTPNQLAQAQELARDLQTRIESSKSK